MMDALSYISPKAVVKASLIHGRGLFAIDKIQAGEIVCVKGGHIFQRSRLREVAANLGPAEIQIADDLFIGPLGDEDVPRVIHVDSPRRDARRRGREILA